MQAVMRMLHCVSALHKRGWTTTLIRIWYHHHLINVWTAVAAIALRSSQTAIDTAANVLTRSEWHIWVRGMTEAEATVEARQTTR